MGKQEVLKVDFSLRADQKMLRDTARQWLGRVHSVEQTRRWREDPVGFDAQRWQEIGSMGWVGLNVPERLGGIDGSTVDALILFEELGRVLFPSPFLSQWLVVTVLGQFCPNLENTPLWERLRDGKDIVAWADWEGGDFWAGESGAYGCTVRSQGAEWVLNGEKHWVLDGAVARQLLVTARMEDGRPCLALVPAQTRGVEVVPLRDAARRRVAAVRLKDVVLAPDALLVTGSGGDSTARDSEAGGVPRSWRQLWGAFVYQGALAVGAELLGAASYVLEAAVEHAKHRHQFGRPIGSFQAIQHKCADMWMHLEVARNLLYYAAVQWEDGHPDAPLAVAQAKLLVTEAAQRAVREGHQILGGLGYTEEHWMPLYFRFVKEGRALFGMPDEWEQRAAECLLDGPRLFTGFGSVPFLPTDSRAV